MHRPRPGSTLFPYTTLFRSGQEGAGVVEAIGADVTRIGVGDHVALSWAPSCGACDECLREDRKSTRLNSSLSQISYAVFCLKKKKTYLRPSVRSTSSKRDTT